jgi:hypothetical protein
MAAENSMVNMITGVDRTYRGRKIAKALKLLTIRYAKAYGATAIRTNNDSENGTMLAINRKLGYRPQPGLYKLRYCKMLFFVGMENRPYCIQELVQGVGFVVADLVNEVVHLFDEPVVIRFVLDGHIRPNCRPVSLNVLNYFCHFFHALYHTPNESAHGEYKPSCD